MDIVGRHVGKGHPHVRVSQNNRIRDVTRRQVQHLVVEERDVQIDGPGRVLVLGAHPAQRLLYRLQHAGLQSTDRQRCLDQDRRVEEIRLVHRADRPRLIDWGQSHYRDRIVCAQLSDRRLQVGHRVDIRAQRHENAVGQRRQILTGAFDLNADGPRKPQRPGFLHKDASRLDTRIRQTERSDLRRQALDQEEAGRLDHPDHALSQRAIVDGVADVIRSTCCRGVRKERDVEQNILPLLALLLVDAHNSPQK